MKLIDSIIDKLTPGHDHGLDDYLIIDPDSVDEGDPADMVVVDWVEDDANGD